MAAGRRARAAKRPAASLRAPHRGVDGRAGGQSYVQVGLQAAQVQGVGEPDEDLTEDLGIRGKHDALPGGASGEEGEDVCRPGRRRKHDVGRERPWERGRGQWDHWYPIHP